MRNGRSATAVPAAVVMSAVALAGCGASQQPGVRTAPSTGPSSTASTASSTASGTASPAKTVPPAAFASVVAAQRTFVLNVHTPDAGSIQGTDAEVPFDQLRQRASELPADRSTPIAVYCRSGRMSAEAVPVLRSLGFTDVTELAGGMNAWTADGRTLLPD